MNLLEHSRARAKVWMNSAAIDGETKKQAEVLLAASDSKALIDNFYKNLEFGTGGLRGIMGVGPNCMNKYTVGVATQGLANYLKKSFPHETIKVAIAHDSRNNSRFFAEVAANVFAGNGIKVYLFAELRPTPLLSFTIRRLKCHSGVVITASHNPKEYNGYKAYWIDGAQLVPPHDQLVIEEVNAITDYGQIKFEPRKELISPVGKEVEDAYYAEVAKIIPGKDSIARHHDLPLVYSSLHGAGITMVPECLKRLGFSNVSIVEEQKTPDGNFPTVSSPNPEEPSAMALALSYGVRNKAELIMATDPDTDRVGIAIRKPGGEFLLLSGNQALSLLLFYILKNFKGAGYIAKTIVTTELIDAMATRLGIECVNTLTGFKYIAELIRNNEGKKKFIAAGEESYGYMVGDFVRDKDAVSACAFFASMAANARDEGKNLYDWLMNMYVAYGLFKEGLVNVVKKGAEGEREIKRMMEAFRKNPPQSLAGQKVIRALDYQSGVEKDLVTGKEKALAFPKSDVLQFYTADGSKISVRPSGTEPKIKFYISVSAKLESAGAFGAVSLELDNKIEELKKAMGG